MEINVLYDMPVFERFSHKERVEALIYFRNVLIACGEIMASDVDNKAICNRKRLVAVAGERFVRENERLVQSLTYALA